MILKAGTKMLLGLSLILSTQISSAQMYTEGKIVFERKVNLKKMFKDNDRVKNFLPEDMDYRIEEFTLHFNDSLSAYVPVPSEDEAGGFMKYLTTHNTIYMNRNTGEKVAVLDMWGTKTFIEDSLREREWKITNKTRNIAGFECRRALWEQNDSTRVYAWFSTELVPTVGPEGFYDLPGGILGLATEDGSMIYFAKSVEQMEVPMEKLTIDVSKEDTYTEEELKKRILEKMGQWVKKRDMDGMFDWL